MKKIGCLLGLFLIFTISLDAQCWFTFTSKDGNPFDCTAKVTSQNGELLSTYEMQDNIVVLQPVCLTKSSYVWTFYRDSVIIDRVILSRRGNSNRFKITQQKESLIEVKPPK